MNNDEIIASAMALGAAAIAGPENTKKLNAVRFNSVQGKYRYTMTIQRTLNKTPKGKKIG